MSDALMAALAQIDLAETEVINAKAWSGGEQAKVHCNFALTAITTARQAITEATKTGGQDEHNLKDVRCECCEYMTYTTSTWVVSEPHPRKLNGCIRATSQQVQWLPIESNLPPCKESAIEYLVFDTLNNKVGHDYWMVPEDGSEPFWNHYGEYVSHWMPLPQGPNVVD